MSRCRTFSKEVGPLVVLALLAAGCGDKRVPPVDQGADTAGDSQLDSRVDLPSPDTSPDSAKPTCTDGKKNGKESDVDCGGTCSTCAAGKQCATAADCSSGVCTGGVCAFPTCKDGKKNGGESDIDCGGPSCNACPDGKKCQAGADCHSGVCSSAGACIPATCKDGKKNGNETDIDCGGACSACGAGRHCKTATDCASSVCTSGVCAFPSCTDNVKNGGETDVDCGGVSCGKCADGKKCAAGNHCKSGVCSGGVCAVAACTDKVKNGKETDIDCGGGVCSVCASGKQCAASTDCVSGVCAAGVCAFPTCKDKVKNGSETDVDCGGGTCSACADGKKCVAGADCQSSVCSSSTSTCSVASCGDGVKNGKETDVDCGGACSACAAGKQCSVKTDCGSGVCTAGICAFPTCKDGVKNDGETDVDCGGTFCPACATGKTCTLHTDCFPHLCEAGGKCAAAASCAQILAAYPKSFSGVYSIQPVSGGKLVKVHCDMTAEGSKWTIFARSTYPSKWTNYNTYALGHYEHWIDAGNYTHDVRKLLAKSTATIQLRIYDHVSPKDMDARFYVKASDLVGVNLDDTTKQSTTLSYSLVSGTFDKSKKAYSVGQKIKYILRVGQQDAYVFMYCDLKTGKSFFNFLTGDPSYVHATVCGRGLGIYRNKNKPTLHPVYNTGDAGRRVSLAYRVTPQWKKKGTKQVAVRFGKCNKTDCKLSSPCTAATVGKEARIAASAEVKGVANDTGWAQGHTVSISGHLLTTTGECSCGSDYNKTVSAVVYRCEY